MSNTFSDRLLFRLIARLSGMHRLQPPKPVRQPSPTPPAPYRYRPEQPFLYLNGQEYLSHNDAMRHFFITGKSGSGKTTGPMKAILESAMRQGWGILACTVKGDETTLIQALARRTGRLDSLIVVNPANGWKFSYLDWELNRPGEGSGLVENAVNGLMTVIENASPKGVRESKDTIWEEAPKRWLRHAMLLIREAQWPVTMDHIKAVADGMPSSDVSGSLVWPSDSFLQRCLQRAKALGGDAENIQLCELYFTREMSRPGISRFASNVLVSVTSSLDPFLSPGPAKKLFFSGETTFTPDFWRKGAIIVLDLSLAEWGSAGKAAQTLVRHACFEHALRRQGVPFGERPCLFYCDEFQALMTRQESSILERGRSSALSACVAVQNLPAMYMALEAHRGKDIAHNMLGNFGHWIMCQNDCSDTNEKAVSAIGKAITLRRSTGTSTQTSQNEGWNAGGNSSWGESGGQSSGNWGRSSGVSGGMSQSWGASDTVSEHLEVQIPTSVFLNLANGGPESRVESLLLSPGKRFQATGKPYTKVTWLQR